MDLSEAEKTNKSLIKAWAELNKINAEIRLKESELTNKYDVQSNKLKEILISCSVSNDKMINTIIATDAIAQELSKLYKRKYEHQLFINTTLEILKLNNIELCIVFLKEYQHLKWDKIAKKLSFSKRQCQRYYAKYNKKVEEISSVWTNY